MGAIASQITSLTIVFSTVYSDADQRKYQSSASLAFVQGIHRGPVNSPHKWPVTRKMFPFDDVIMDRLADSCVFCFWLHWCHMDVILSQITGNSAVCLTDRSSNDKWNGYICIYHNSVKLHGALWGESIGERCGFHSQMDMMQKAFPCHAVIKSHSAVRWKLNCSQSAGHSVKTT